MCTCFSQLTASSWCTPTHTLTNLPLKSSADIDTDTQVRWLNHNEGGPLFFVYCCKHVLGFESIRCESCRMKPNTGDLCSNKYKPRQGSEVKGYGTEVQWPQHSGTFSLFKCNSFCSVASVLLTSPPHVLSMGCTEREVRITSFSSSRRVWGLWEKAGMNHEFKSNTYLKLRNQHIWQISRMCFK